MTDAQDAPVGVNIKENGKKLSGKLTLGTVLGSLALLISTAVGIGVAYDKFVLQPQTIALTSKYIQKVQKNLTEQINGVETFTDEDVAGIEKQIVDKVTTNIDTSIETQLNRAKGQVINDIKVYFQQNPPEFQYQQPQEPDTGLLVNTVLNRLRQSGELEVSANATDNFARTRIREIQIQMDGISQKVKVASFEKPNGMTKTPKRLKEFNIIAPPLKDNTVFVIDAPKKNGKPNIITLTMGEPFYSKYGSHKVTGIEDGPKGTLRLRVTGNFFIDDKREEFTASELAALKKSREHKSKSGTVTPPSTGIKAKNQPSTKLATNMVELKNWSVITVKPKENEVLVYNPNTNTPLALTKNTYVSGIGTVRNIDFRTGETKFERYFIRGNQ
ncbi:hypothetical protein VIBNISOn1_190020 [Vibrio nigripulchritudo SOn1]|uniref:Uncharacterized protein n=1 Tax=Vibrio nigripulchritudo SOn1 TaxID=1238450 RepID=A0AAV2VQ61_9VIBR|nr:hypothetical protein [Vibrio nigripulchritudo]CCO46801.1 hypothetical protein VIBNISOn1_190020 [Vibrio nigripulchritudo SOn1]